MLKFTLTLLTSILFYVNVFAATTKQQAIEIFRHIVSSNKMVLHPLLRFSNSKDINASCDIIVITINQGMLDNSNIDELALVIGHELGHFYLHHYRSTPSNEFAADKQGCYYANKAGYSCHKGKEIFKKFRQVYSKTHPHPKDRYRRLP